MKLRLLLITGFLAFIGQFAQAQCSAYGYFTQNGSSVIFYDSSFSANGHDAYWDFGDGSSGSFGTQVFHSYAANGTYNPCLYIYDSLANCADTLCFTLTVASYSSCSATFTSNVDSTNSLLYYFYGSAPPAGGSASFTFWDFANYDTTYYGQNTSELFPSAGTYRVYYIVYDSAGQMCDSMEMTLTITGGSSSCNAAFTYTLDNSNPYKINFSNTSTNAVSSYWWFGGSNSSTLYSPSHTFATAGYKNVCLTTYDSSGNLCDSICQTVYVPGQTSNTSCDASFYAFTQQGTTYFYDSTNQNNIIEYSFGDGSYGYSSSPSHTYPNSGSYNACLFVYDVDSVGDTLLCDSFCQTITIAATSNCNASFTAHPDSLNMSASSFPVLFSNNSTGSNYIWHFGDGTTDTTTNPTHIYTAAGTYTACLLVVSAYDSLSLPVICDSTCVTFTVGNPIVGCNPTISYIVDSINVNTHYFYGSNPPTGGRGEWIVVDGNNVNYYSGTSAVHTFSNAGSAFVQYDVYNADSTFCDSTSVVISVPVLCQASYYLGVDTTNQFNLFIINNSTGTSPTTNYFWSFGDGSSSTAQYPTHQYASFGLYNLCLTITDSATGCSSTHCDSIGLDSNGNLLKMGAFGITVVGEKALLSAPKVDAIQGVSVYPNPTGGRFTIELNALQSDDLEITVLSSMGQVVSTSTQRVNAGVNTLQMDLSNNTTGIYFVTMRAGNQVKNVKLNIISE